MTEQEGILWLRKRLRFPLWMRNCWDVAWYLRWIVLVNVLLAVWIGIILSWITK